MIKLLATDLDGTLFYPKKRLNGFLKENEKFLLSFLDSNKDIMIASGRNCGIFNKIEKKLKHHLYFMGCNGSFYMDKDKKIIENKKPLDPNVAARCYLTLKKNYSIFFWFLLDDSDKLYYLFDENIPTYMKIAFHAGNNLGFFYKEKLIGGEESFLKALQQNNNYKLMPVFSLDKKNTEKASNICFAVSEIFKDDLEVALTNGSLEITKKNVNKGNGLNDFCNQYKIAKDEVIVVGDSYNDVSMFKMFPHSFCMSHADDEVKKYANHIIDYEYEIQKYIDDESLLKDDQIKNVD